jgi:hypothetical protein
VPPLILILAGILGGAALVRFAARESRRINRELDETRQSHVGDRENAPTLRRDPDTGTYRPG